MSRIRPDRIEKLGILIGGAMLEVAVRIWSPSNPQATLFCLHGFAGNGQDFGFLGAMLRNFGVETIAVDMPGRGASTFLGDPNLYSLKLIQIAVDEAKKLASAPLIIAGTSWGGVIAASVALKAKESSKGLVLIDAPLISNEQSEHPHEDFIRDEAFHQFSSARSAKIYFTATRNLHHVAPDDLAELLAASVMKIEGGFRMRYDPALTHTIGRRSPFNLVPNLSSAVFPILSVLGTHSHLVQDPQQSTARAAIPGMQTILAEGEAHPPSLSRSALLEQIGSFVRGCLVAAAGS